MLSLDSDKLSSSFRTAFPTATQQQIAAFSKLAASIAADADISDLRWAAYMLATVKHECADTFEPIIERGSLSYFNKYIGKLGNTMPDDAFNFRGRGFVQITGRDNYQKFTAILAMPDGGLIATPDLALDFDNAYRIMSYGMRNGVFTGKKLGNYISVGRCDYLNARKIINGLDRADTIEAYAQQFEAALTGSQT